MTFSRIVAIVATVGLSTLLGAASLPVAVLAVPTAPYDAFTMNGPKEAYQMYYGERFYDATNATFTLSTSGNGAFLLVQGSGYPNSNIWQTNIQPPVGMTFTVGQTYPTLKTADADNAGLDITGVFSCARETGSVTIKELVRDPGTGAITAFAATYSTNCEPLYVEPTQPPVSGEIRWHSSVDYKAVVISATNTIVFGNQRIGYDSTPFGRTLTGKGSVAVTMGTATIEGPGAAAFAISSDCSGVALSYGQTCLVQVTAHPTAETTFTAELVLPDDTVSGVHRIPLSVTGVYLRTLTSTPTALYFPDTNIGAVSNPLTLTVTSTNLDTVTINQLSINGGNNPAAFSVTADGCSGATLGQGQSCTIDVVAHPSTLASNYSYLDIDSNAGQRTTYVHVIGLDPVGVTINPPSLWFDQVPVGQASAPHTVTLTSAGANAITFGAAGVTGAHAADFTPTADTCSNATIMPGASCAITIVATPGDFGFRSASLSITDNSQIGVRTVPLSVNGVEDPTGTYYPRHPERILDTRTGAGAPIGKLGPGSVLHLQVPEPLIAPTGVSAVVLNVTVTGATAASYLTVYPGGVGRPTASSLNFVKGWTGANSVTVALGAGGGVDIYNNVGSVHVIADLVGFYAGSSAILPYYTGGRYHPTTPERVLDTRTWGYGPVPGGYAAVLGLYFGAEVATHLRAVAVNITAVKPTTAGYLTAWDGESNIPYASTLNFTSSSAAVPNMAIVQVSNCPDGDCDYVQLAVLNSAGATHILVDLFGVYDDSSLPGGLRFQPLTPTRIADSRLGLGLPAALGTQSTGTITVSGAVADADTWALAMNVTAVKPTSSTYVTVWPTGPLPTVSNLNPAKGQTVPNAVTCELTVGNTFNVYNRSGSTHLLADVVGRFVFDPLDAAGATGPSRGAGSGELSTPDTVGAISGVAVTARLAHVGDLAGATGHAR